MKESVFKLLLKLEVEDPVAELLAESVYSFKLWRSLSSAKSLAFATNGGKGNSDSDSLRFPFSSSGQ